MTSKEAAQLKDYMTAVTDYGTASVLGGQTTRLQERPERQNIAQIRKKIIPGSLELLMLTTRNL